MIRIIPDHYNVDTFRRGIRNPSLLCEEIARIVTNWRFSRTYQTSNYLNEDWDTLILLDACRYDVFEHVNDINGRLDHRISLASTSRDFIEDHFVGNTLHDTVYITANAYVRLIDDEVFHYVRPVELNPIRESEKFESSENDILPPDSFAALPADVVKQSLECHRRFPNKRMIIHFMQPHIPFIGPFGLELHRRILRQDKTRRPDSQRARWGALGNNPYHFMNDENIDITREEIQNAYAENLELVLSYLPALIDKLDGKTVISADHGEMLGEKLYRFGKSWYDHPSMLNSIALRKVPWHVIEGVDRRQISSDPPVASDRLDEEGFEMKLEALGYL